MKEVIEKNEIALSTEEYETLIKEIKEQGGQVTHTSSFSNGERNGVSVQYHIPKPPPME